jgi:plasmid stability protein
MITITIPDNLEQRLIVLAGTDGRSAEKTVLDILQDYLDNFGAYQETEYLMKSKANKECLDKAVSDIRAGIYEEHELIND